jgi:uncharacterized membrane protein YsdA (DUF1294 family)
MGSFSDNDMIVEIYSIVGSFLNRTKYLYWINVATFFLYFIDKLFSVMGCRQIRIPEWWLLFISGLGGAPSAMLAAWIFNHKTRKESYKNSFNFIVILHIIVCCVPYLCGKEYHNMYSIPVSITKRSFGALYYYVPIYGIAMLVYYTLGPCITLLKIVFSPIIFIVNLVVLVMKCVLLAGLCGVAIALALNAFQNPDETIGYLQQQWASVMKTIQPSTSR